MFLDLALGDNPARGDVRDVAVNGHAVVPDDAAVVVVLSFRIPRSDLEKDKIYCKVSATNFPKKAMFC